ncbi:helix-turn-helix domain protein [Roseovarius mucosus]|uniref:Helix-turn-helix domain protein n=1 Tax=Roseovarius mucosus TaxID=215743 RepID=A0A1V0RUB4_9RHOB|nr:helix-turn-helix domain-containing protein [Roseovarius mucosus]ARE85371.1 helix-turn-helix domain protein [Roseovarius mucosus]
MPTPTFKTPNQPRVLLTVKDVAVLDNCSEKTVRRAIASGLLQAIRVGPGGRLLRIDPAAHAAYRAASQW